MYPRTHTYTDSHKCYKTFKLTHAAHTQPQTRPTQVNTSQSFSAATGNTKQQNENIGSCVILYCSSY